MTTWRDAGSTMTNPSDAHPLDDAIALMPVGEHLFAGRTSAAYGNMVGPFGGITAAQLVAAVLAHPQRLGEPVAATVNFCAAVADGPFVVDARPVRTNRSSQHWIVSLQQHGQTTTTATVVTAVRRPTWAADEERMPDAPLPEDVPRTAREGFARWLERYEMRFVEGPVPQPWDGTECADSRTRLWVRDAPARPLDHASLTALCDVFFPRIWRRRAKPVPIGTVSMTIYFHADAERLAAIADGYLFAQAQGQGFRGGYFDQTAQLWDAHGALVATTHQVVYYKE